MPMDAVARSLAVVEPLTAQLYPAVLIAVVLGVALGTKREAERQMPAA